VLDGIIILAAIVLNPLARRRRRQVEEVENMDKEKCCRNAAGSAILPRPRSDASTLVEDAEMVTSAQNGKIVEPAPGKAQVKEIAQ
ncbi:hypothetical protein FRB90_010468, partial [Tulasnella sp. 427]